MTAGADQFGIGLEVLAHLLEDGGVAVDADHEVLAEHQLDLPGADFLLGRLPLRLREPRTALSGNGSPGERRAQRLADEAAFQSHQARTAASRWALPASNSPGPAKRIMRTSLPWPSS